MAASRRGVARPGSARDKLVALPAAAGWLLVAAAGCSGGTDKPPSVAHVTPAAAYDDAVLSLAIVGDGFRPTYAIDARTGTSSVDTGGFRAFLTPSDGGGAPIELQDVVWQSVGLLGGQLPAGTPAGFYELSVRDPRGRGATLPLAFQSLGADTAAPVVRIASPPSGSSFAVGASVPIVVVANDGQGVIALLDAVMSSGSGAEQPYHCATTGEGNVSCAFTLPAPGAANNPDMLTIHVTAVDEAGLVGDARAQFRLVRAPTFDSLSPARGTTLGGTLVHIEGGGLMNGVPEVRFDGTVAEVRSTSISSVDVVAPMHPLAATVPVTVTISGVTVRKSAGFTYLAPPLVRNIFPASGPAAGGFPVTIIGDNFAAGTTHIFFGMVPLRCVRYSNANRIDGLAPAGMGTQAVGADDDEAGKVPHGTVPFTYLQDGGAGPIEVADGGLSGDASTAVTPDAGDDAGCPGAP